MNPNWLGVISALLAFVAFFVTYRAAMDLESRRRLPLAILAIILAVPGASFAAYYVHIFAPPSWYYQFRSVPGTEFSVVLLGIAGGFTASILPRIALILPFLGVAAFSVVPIMKPFIGPIPPETLNDEWDGEICLQSTPSTCGAASVATILNFFGDKVTEAEIAAEAHSYMGGTESWYLARAARARGHEVRFQSSAGFDPETVFPALVGVRLGSFGHFIPILRRDGKRFLIGDPLRGREWLSHDELLKRYGFTGFHMTVRR